MYISLIVLSLFAIFKNDVVHCKNDDLAKIDSVYQEEFCSRTGGMCVIAPDCPPGHLTDEKGLCPAQQSNSVECCYGSSVKESRCRKLGGECLAYSYCKVRPKYQQVQDCPDNTRCCILV